MGAGPAMLIKGQVDKKLGQLSGAIDKNVAESNAANASIQPVPVPGAPAPEQTDIHNAQVDHALFTDPSTGSSAHGFADAFSKALSALKGLHAKPLPIGETKGSAGIAGANDLGGSGLGGILGGGSTLG